MKKIIILTLFVFAGITKNFCFASDTLIVFFNTANSNQYVTKSKKRIYIPPLFKLDMCVIEKACWFTYPINDSGKTNSWQFCFKYLLVTDSITQDETDAVDNAWGLTKRYQQLYRSCKSKQHPFDKKLALAIEVFKEYNKYGHQYIKKEQLVYNDTRVIDLSLITTKEQLLALKNKMGTKTILLIDMAKQKRKNKWLAYKVSGINLSPIEGGLLQF